MLRLTLITLITLLAAPAGAIEYVTIARDGKTHHVQGEVLVTAKDGGMMLATANGQRWLIEPKEITRRSHDDKLFVPLTTKAMAEDMLGRLPRSFRAHKTAHYVICYDTSETYARWCGALLERLYRSFENYWTRKKVPLTKPRVPLVVVVCGTRAAYEPLVRDDLGTAGAKIVGYYNLKTNRIMMRDLTGIEALRGARGQRITMSHINAMLSRPRAQQMVATVIHEATHQIAYNRGLHQRLSDIPFWVAEGLALYFETPDLRSSKGWSTIGKVNRSRLIQFRRYLRKRPRESLLTLITADTRFRDPKQVLDTYAESWALTYYLMRTKPKQYQAYLKVLAQKKPLIWDTPEDRLEQFKKAFGSDLAKFDKDWLRYVQKIR